MLLIQPLSVAEAEKVDARACGARDSGFDFHPSPHLYASMAKLVDALGLGPSGQPWGFESLYSYHGRLAQLAERGTLNP